MAGVTSENVAVGEIAGYGRVYNPFSKKAKVIVKANGRTIRVPVDYRQKRYIQKKHRIGDKVAVGFYGGEWHIGSPPNHPNDYSQEQDISDLDLLQYELEGLDLLELAVRPLAAHHSKGEPDGAIEEDDVENLKQKAMINLLLSEIDERRDYLKEIEQDFKKNSDAILEDLGLSHLHGINQKKKLKQAMAGEEINNSDTFNLEYIKRLDMMISQNSEIISRLDEIVYLLKDMMVR